MELEQAKQMIEEDKKERAKAIAEVFEDLLKQNNCKYGIDLRLENNIVVPTLYFIAE
jgi:hypothetical protein